MARPKRPKHRLDDRPTDYVLLLLFILAQGWSTIGVYQLAKWAGFSDWMAAVPAALIDGVAFITARAAASEVLPNQKGWRVRSLAAWIAGACFALSLAANVTHSHVTIPPGTLPLQTILHDALSGIPVALLVATLVLRTRRGAWRTKVVAEEAEAARIAREQDERERQERAERQAAEREARELQDRRDAAARAEQERQEQVAANRARQEQERADRERREAAAAEERQREREADLERTRIAAQAETAKATAAVQQTAAIPAARPRAGGAEPSDGPSAAEQIDALIFKAWAKGDDPNCAAIDRKVGVNNYARGRRRALGGKGWGPGKVPPEYATPTGENETAGENPTAVTRENESENSPRLAAVR